MGYRLQGGAGVGALLTDPTSEDMGHPSCAGPVLAHRVLKRGQSVLAGVAILAVVLAAGCSQTRQFQPQVDRESLSDTEFLHYLADVPVVTFEEACRGVLIAADGADAYDGYAERGAELERRGVIRASWGLKPDDVLDRGTLAFMLAEVCDLPPSVDSTIFGSWGLGDRRYALKRAVYREMIVYGPTYEMITGGEFVEALANADAYMAKAGKYDANVGDINAPEDLGALRQPGT